uniref:Uncharacterized protein n=1 Tax=Nelumbo nucifera TaxID=4432 RepID=A0A822XYI1_NELNU|nr:TPA_asm: hypothetical protein HUJ06_026227 [Nelumbo nucifera]
MMKIVVHVSLSCQNLKIYKVIHDMNDELGFQSESYHCIKNIDYYLSFAILFM